MLNKQKSKRRNSWKYAVVLPALAAFILAFQVKVVAQEKQQPAVKADVLQWSIKIDKDTKDSELEQHKEKIKSEFNGTANFSSIERNDKSEITAIKVEVAASGKNSVYEVSGNGPIQPFTIQIDKKEGSDFIFSFGTPGNMGFSEAIPDKAFVFEGDTLMYDRHPVVRPFNAPPAIVYSAPQPFAFAMPSNNVALNFGNDNALIVINGVKYAKGQEIMLPAGQIVTSITTLTDKEGKKKYGKEGKKGVIEITTSSEGQNLFAGMPKPVFDDAHAKGFVLNNIDPQVHFDNRDRIIIRADDFHFEDMDGIELELKDPFSFDVDFNKAFTPQMRADIIQRIKQLEAEGHMRGNIVEQAEKMLEDRIKQNGHLQHKLEENREKMEQERMQAEKARAKAEEDRTKRRN